MRGGGRGVFCQKASAAHRALHHLFSASFTRTHTQRRHTTHEHTHTDTHVLSGQQGLSAAISSPLSENEPLSLVTTGPLCRNTHTHTHARTFCQPVNLYCQFSKYKPHIDLFSVTARFTRRTTHRWTMVNTIHKSILIIIINQSFHW